MGKLLHMPPFLGTRDGICTYMRRGEFIVRSASSLTAERVKEDERFEKTRQHAALMGRASRVASVVYKEVSANNKSRQAYRNLTGTAIRLLRDGVTDEQAIQQLKQCI